MPTAQSAYRKYHSMETATAKVFNDLLLGSACYRQGQVLALCLLDLTAAFDIVDHQLLLWHLECQFGQRGITLGQSYLSGRSYRVIYAGSTSSVIYIICSVPQGSVLGPLLFIICGQSCGGHFDMVLPSIPSRMTRSCTCTVTARTPSRQPLS